MPPSTPIETIWEIWASPGSTPPSTHLGNLGVTREHPAPATPAEAPSTSRIEHRPPISNRCHREHRSKPFGKFGRPPGARHRAPIWEILASPGSTQHQRRQRKHPAPAELSTVLRSATDATENTDRNPSGNLGVPREHATEHPFGKFWRHPGAPSTSDASGSTQHQPN